MDFQFPEKFKRKKPIEKRSPWNIPGVDWVHIVGSMITGSLEVLADSIEFVHAREGFFKENGGINFSKIDLR